MQIIVEPQNVVRILDASGKQIALLQSETAISIRDVDTQYFSTVKASVKTATLCPASTVAVLTDWDEARPDTAWRQF